MSIDHKPFDADLVDVTDVLPPWLPLDKALIEEEPS
jgi:hypothetical protein